MLKKALLTAVLGAALATSPANASLYSDDLSRCLLKSTSEDDKATFVRWIFAAMASSPHVAGLSTASRDERARLHREAADLTQRLMLSDCRNETVAALKYDGIGTIEASFGLLGQTAMRDLMMDPAVVTEMEAFASFFDQEKWAELTRDAGIPMPDAAPKAAVK